MKKEMKFQICWHFFCYNVPNNTHKTNNYQKVHALFTKRKKENIKNVHQLFKNEL